MAWGQASRGDVTRHTRLALKISVIFMLHLVAIRERTFQFVRGEGTRVGSWTRYERCKRAITPRVVSREDDLPRGVGGSRSESNVSSSRGSREAIPGTARVAMLSVHLRGPRPTDTCENSHGRDGSRMCNVHRDLLHICMYALQLHTCISDRE